MPEPGSLLAQRFVVERRLGAGGMGVVYQVRHASLGERFALKVLNQPGPVERGAGERFNREARAAAGLRSEHVVRVTDFGHLDDGSPYFVMELVDGPNLAAELQRRGPLPLDEAVRSALHACAALAEAHALGIVHRDIKPANLLLTARSDGSPLVKLADFGIAKVLSAGSLTDTRMSLGSPAYMAPEQIRDSRVVDPRSDVWSLGITLHELLCGQTPFHAYTAPGILARVIDDEPTRLSSLRAGLPEGLYRVIDRCLQKDPAARFASVEDLADALSPFAPEPDEGARIRRIGAFARRPAPAPTPAAQATPAAGQITETSTSLTQGAEPPPRASERTTSTRPAAPSRSRWLIAGAVSVAGALGAFALLRRPPAPSESPTPPPSQSAVAAPSTPAPPPTPSTPEPPPVAPVTAVPLTAVPLTAVPLTAVPVTAVPIASAPPAEAPQRPGPAPQGSSSQGTSQPTSRPGAPVAGPKKPPREQPPQLGEFGSRQ